jgi:hypothetical protein
VSGEASIRTDRKVEKGGLMLYHPPTMVVAPAGHTSNQQKGT